MVCNENNTPKLLRLMLATLIVAFTTQLFSSSVLADSFNAGLYSKDSSPFGIPYSDWVHRWWQWNQGIPAAEHPRDNFTERTCQSNQNGPVWFLPDILTGKEERSCTIPSGKGILVPLLTGECHNDVPPIMSDEALIKCSSEGDEFGVLTAILDGKEIQNLDQYRTKTGFYNITVVEGNIFDLPAGTFKGHADGFFVFLEPPAPGKHDLTLRTSVVNPTTPSYNYAAESIYHLTIK